MSKKRPRSGLPEEVLGLLGTVFWMPAIAVLAASILPPITNLQRVEVSALFWAGISTGASGVVALFVARLPLYRERRFFAFGPRALDSFHRRLYWLACLLVVAGIACLGMVWLRVR